MRHFVPSVRALSTRRGYFRAGGGHEPDNEQHRVEDDNTRGPPLSIEKAAGRGAEKSPEKLETGERADRHAARGRGRDAGYQRRQVRLQDVESGEECEQE